MSRRQSPSEFLKQIIGKPVVVKLNSGIDYRGIYSFLFCINFGSFWLYSAVEWGVVFLRSFYLPLSRAPCYSLNSKQEPFCS